MNTENQKTGRFSFQQRSVLVLVGAAVMFAGALQIIGCSASNNGNSLNPNFNSDAATPTPTPTPTPNTATPTPSGSGPSVDASSFYVQVVQTSSVDPIDTVLHKFHNYSLPCEVPASSTTAQDVQCLLNIREQDLYFNGLTLDVHVPIGLCNYVEQHPYWYYRAQPGYPPTSITVDDVNSTCSVSYNGGTTTTFAQSSSGVCVFPNGDGQATDAGSVTSTYDYSLLDSGAPNCAVGSYTLSIVKPPAASGGSNTTTTSTGSYGGLIGNCVDGPTRNNSWPYSLSGFPETTQTASSLVGVDATYLITAPIKAKGLKLNVYGANFYGWSNYVAGTTPTIPKGIAPVTDLAGNSIPAGNEAYTYNCLDEAGNIKHRIRVYINEWDVDGDYALYKSSYGGSAIDPLIVTGTGSSTSVSPDYGTTAVEGTTCDAGTSVGGYCDSYWDWDDITAIGATYGYFPYDYYEE